MPSVSLLVAILIGITALAAGAGFCYFVFRYTSMGLLKKAEQEAEIIKKNKIVEAKEKFIALKLEHDNQLRQDEQRKQQREQQLQQREQQLNSRQGELQRAQNELNQRGQQLEQQQKAIDFKRQEIERLHKQAEQQRVKVEYGPFGKWPVAKEIEIGDIGRLVDKKISRNHNNHSSDNIHELPTVLSFYFQADFCGVLNGIAQLYPAQSGCSENELPSRVGFCSCDKVVAAKENIANQVARMPEYTDNHQLVNRAWELLD